MTILSRHLGFRLLLMVVMTAVVGGRAVAQDADADRVAKVSAAFVLNFLRYTQWPETSFADETTPIRLGMVGDSPILPYLRRLAVDKRVHDRVVVVQVIAPPSWAGDAADDKREAERFVAAVRGVHAVFVAKAAGEHVPAVVAAAAGHPVLTIGDVPDFIDKGGMLGLLLSRQRIVFDANRTAITGGRLKVSSKVLKLARRVREDEG